MSIYNESREGKIRFQVFKCSGLIFLFVFCLLIQSEKVMTCGICFLAHILLLSLLMNKYYSQFSLKKNDINEKIPNPNHNNNSDFATKYTHTHTHTHTQLKVNQYTRIETRQTQWLSIGMPDRNGKVNLPLLGCRVAPHLSVQPGHCRTVFLPNCSQLANKRAQWQTQKGFRASNCPYAQSVA